MPYQIQMPAHNLLNGMSSTGKRPVGPFWTESAAPRNCASPPANFPARGLRLLEVEGRVWHDFWVNAEGGVLTTPGQTGEFTVGGARSRPKTGTATSESK
jgi:hypothetical protein